MSTGKGDARKGSKIGQGLNGCVLSFAPGTTKDDDGDVNNSRAQGRRGVVGDCIDDKVR